MSDNRIFNINGEGKEQLEKVLELAMQGHADKFYRVNNKGFIIHWSSSDKDDIQELPVPHDAKMFTELIWKWLEEQESEDIQSKFALDGWDCDADHDGHNGRGWRAYVEDWGHVDGSWSARVAVLPVFLWYGK